MLYYQNFFQSEKENKSLLMVGPTNKEEINKNKSHQILILVCRSYLSLGPLGIDGKIFLISKNRFLNVTTLTFPAIEILDWLVFSPFSRHAPYSTATAIAHGSFPKESGLSFTTDIICIACLAVFSLMPALLAILVRCEVESIEGSRILSFFTSNL